jgi:hypothetical protein
MGNDEMGIGASEYIDLKAGAELPAESEIRELERRFGIARPQLVPL